MRLYTLLAIAACLLAPSAGDADVLLVGNKSAHTLWALDPVTGEKLAEFETGVGPHEVEVSSDHRYAVVSNYGEREAAGNTLTVIEWPAARVARVIDLGENTRPHGMAFLSGYLAAITTEGSDSVLVVDVARGNVVSTIGVGEGVAHMVAASRDGRFAYVTNISAGTLEKVEVLTGEVLQSVATGAGAEGVAVVDDRREVWVTNRGDDTVSVIDAESLEVLATLESAGFPIRIAVTPTGSHALVTNARAATLSVFDIRDRSLVATLQIADPDGEYQQTLLGDSALPIGIEVAPDGKRAFVAISGGNEIAVIDTADWEIVDRWETGREPDALGWVVTPGEGMPRT
ncbi:YncE family protein [Thioalkalivibrio sp. XN279]|uniref:YncE family protein n=1 Tax=Thioalkalivibrio sp. XN279 TaxID=2714953 RepID=UPI00140D88B5|nr:cytochrome D1 domain-containing protein [Thioalkalivibrio sp. XN279]NHA15752.1 beta-propeller fold lactonase family protein [Thioalkalivibrio sp. XN279]